MGIFSQRCNANVSLAGQIHWTTSGGLGADGGAADKAAGQCAGRKAQPGRPGADDHVLQHPAVGWYSLTVYKL